MTIIEHAYAKINLGLNIQSRRDDGYHSILSIFQTVDLFDTLEFTGSHEPKLIISDTSLPNGPENLVTRAETLLINHYPNIPHLHITLQKRIPVGAGLGGGSSDAAAALRGINAFHGLSLPMETVMSYAAKIGSDVPFLIKGGTAIVDGRGEHVEPIEWPFDFIYVIVYPGFPISTSWAYNQIKNPSVNSSFEKVVAALRDGTVERDIFLSAMVNDFEAPVFAHHPILNDIKQQLIASGAINSIMSGSGSSIIGLYESEINAHHAANVIGTHFGKQCSTLTARAVDNGNTVWSY
jgi:4-diphosphocytidyl-2-C-methyl-D-erythritol kinase